MSNQTSSIVYPAGDHFVAIRKSLVEVCKELGIADPICGAALLNYFVNWMDNRILHAQQAKAKNTAAVAAGKEPTEDEGLWIWHTIDKIQEDLLGVFGRNKIVDTIDDLWGARLLCKRNNPIHKWDKTTQYLLDIERLQQWINGDFGVEINYPSVENNLSSEQNQPIEPNKNNLAIHKNKNKRNKKNIPAATPQGDEEPIATTKPRDLLFDEIAKSLFGIDPFNAVLVQATAGRIAKLKSLATNLNADAETIQQFVKWYKEQHPNLSLPQGTSTFATNFNEWQQSRPVVQSKATRRYFVDGNEVQLEADGSYNGSRPSWTVEFVGDEMHFKF